MTNCGSSGTAGDVQPANAIDHEPGMCDECRGKINFELGQEDYIPEDPAKTHHHCCSCGLVDYMPPIRKTVSKSKFHRRYNAWMKQSKVLYID